VSLELSLKLLIISAASAYMRVAYIPAVIGMLVCSVLHILQQAQNQAATDATVPPFTAHLSNLGGDFQTPRVISIDMHFGAGADTVSGVGGRLFIMSDNFYAGLCLATRSILLSAQTGDL